MTQPANLNSFIHDYYFDTIKDVPIAYHAWWEAKGFPRNLFLQKIFDIIYIERLRRAKALPQISPIKIFKEVI